MRTKKVTAREFYDSYSGGEYIPEMQDTTLYLFNLLRVALRNFGYVFIDCATSRFIDNKLILVKVVKDE